MRAALAAVALLLEGALACASSPAERGREASTEARIDGTEPSPAAGEPAPFLPGARSLDDDARSAEGGAVLDGAGQGSQAALGVALKEEAESLRAKAEAQLRELERLRAQPPRRGRTHNTEELETTLRRTVLRLEAISRAMDADPTFAEDGALHQELSELRLRLIQAETLLRLYAR